MAARRHFPLLAALACFVGLVVAGVLALAVPVARERDAAMLHGFVGLDLADWHALGTVEAYGYGKQTTVFCFEALSHGRALTIDAGEIEEARWFALADPPVPLGLDAHVVLTKLLGTPSSD